MSPGCRPMISLEPNLFTHSGAVLLDPSTEQCCLLMYSFHQCHLSLDSVLWVWKNSACCLLPAFLGLESSAHSGRGKEDLFALSSRCVMFHPLPSFQFLVDRRNTWYCDACSWIRCSFIKVHHGLQNELMSNCEDPLGVWSYQVRISVLLII